MNYIFVESCTNHWHQSQTLTINVTSCRTWVFRITEMMKGCKSLKFKTREPRDGKGNKERQPAPVNTPARTHTVEVRKGTWIRGGTVILKVCNQNPVALIRKEKMPSQHAITSFLAGKAIYNNQGASSALKYLFLHSSFPRLDYSWNSHTCTGQSPYQMDHQAE